MSYTGTKGRVLIATTDAGFLKGLRTHLTGAGYEVVCECSDGKEAVREAAALHPDAVIAGLLLPGLDGAQVVSAVKAAHPAIAPICFITTSVSNWLMVEYMLPARENECMV